MMKINPGKLLRVAFFLGLSGFVFLPLVVHAEEEADPAEIAIGERLFLETRFAQFFFANSGGDSNATLAQGDPVMDTTETPDGTLPGPFAGQSMNCSACHLVDAQLETPGGGMRSYADFARRSPVPDRVEDDLTHAPRNSPSLVNASLPRKGGLLVHFDAEFGTMEDLVKGTLSGRNYGWLASEQAMAFSHVVHIIKNDNGTGDLAQEFGGAYSEVLKGNTDPEFILPKEFQIDVDTATDDEIVDAVAKILSAYVLDLMFGKDENDEFNLSPYDVFLQKNGLDRKPWEDESNLEYSRRLLQDLAGLTEPQYVTDGVDGEFQFHDQDFAFGPDELEGLKIFLNEPDSGLEEPQGVGNCVSCHAAPTFTDFSFHNTGATQKEYDLIHGDGKFRRLRIPGWNQRNHNPDVYLPATPLHPNGNGRFRSIPTVANKDLTDLGLWNIFANYDVPIPQSKIWNNICEQQVNREVTAFDLLNERPFLHEVLKECNGHILLPKTIALFKTPGLRDLGHSNPYMHNGQEDTLEDVINFYILVSNKARAGILRNGASQLVDIVIGNSDVAPLTKFIKSLNEDYE